MKRPLSAMLITALVALLLLPVQASAQVGGGEGSVSGVVESSGEPVAGVTVLAYTDADGWYGSTVTTTADDGTYTLAGLADGDYKILFHGQAVGVTTLWYGGGTSREDAPPVSVTDGAAVAEVDIDLAPGGSVSGTVRQFGGEPFANIEVWAFATTDGVVGTAATRSATDGTYEITGLPEGEYQVLFNAPEGSGLVTEWWDDQASREASTPVAVSSTASATGIDATLELQAIPDIPVRYRDAVFSEVVTTSDVPYAEVTTRGGEPVTLLADIYQPQGDTFSSRPAMILVHGGSFRFGSKTSPELVDQARVFAAKGYVVVSINYRLSETGCGADEECLLAIADAQADAQTAVRWLRANAADHGVDPDRIAIGGSSAGAITALNVGYNGDDPMPGPLPDVSSQVQAVVSLSGAVIPGGVADPGDAPALLFHNETDPLVQYEWARSTVDEARAADLTAYLRTFPGTGHVPYSMYRAEILDTTTTFLWWMLDLPNADTTTGEAPEVEAPEAVLVP